MTRIERNVMMFVHRHLTELFLSLVFAVGMMMRWLGRGFLAGDMARFLIPWFDEIKESGGLQGLSQQVGDYGLLYQTLISLMTYIDLPNIYQYKLLSIAFDIVLAATACVIVSNGKLTTFKTGGGKCVCSCIPSSDGGSQFCLLGTMRLDVQRVCCRHVGFPLQRPPQESVRVSWPCLCL